MLDKFDYLVGLGMTEHKEYKLQKCVSKAAPTAAVDTFWGKPLKLPFIHNGFCFNIFLSYVFLPLNFPLMQSDLKHLNIQKLF